MSQNSRRDCRACRTQGSMFAAKAPRLGSTGRVIGYIIFIPSVLGAILAALSLLIYILSWLTVPAATNSVESIGQALEMMIGGGFFAIIGFVALIGGLIGLFLITNKRIFQCRRCGFVLD